MIAFRRWMIRGAVVAALALCAAVVIGGSQAQAGGGCHDQPVTTGTEPMVHLVGACFTPTIVRVPAGSTMTWVNDPSGIPHTVTGANGSWGTASELAPGASFSRTFDTDGVYPYYCALHPGMIGAVVVGESAPANVSLAGGAPKSDASRAEAGDSGNSSSPAWPFVAIAIAVGGVAAASGFALGSRRARG